jgi:hypothetical protein
MTTKEEKAAYQRGYNAGKKRLHREVDMRRREAARNAFWQRAYLAALPACITVQGWKFDDGGGVHTTADRSRLAIGFADVALRLAIDGGRI